jgi:methylaspartate ammonia-lyase
MLALSSKILRSVKATFFARKEVAEANLTIYLNNPTGIGEHPRVVEEMVKMVEEIEHAGGCLEVVETIIAKTQKPEED